MSNGQGKEDILPIRKLIFIRKTTHIFMAEIIVANPSSGLSHIGCRPSIQAVIETRLFNQRTNTLFMLIHGF